MQSRIAESINILMEVVRMSKFYLFMTQPAKVEPVR